MIEEQIIISSLWQDSLLGGMIGFFIFITVVFVMEKFRKNNP